MKHSNWILSALSVLLVAGCSPGSSVDGPSQGKLTLVRPTGISVARGGAVKTDILIARENLTGDVTIRFSNLPQGVEIVETDSRIVGERGTYTVRASNEAALVTNHSATVTATGGPGAMSVSEAINITVVEK